MTQSAPAQAIVAELLLERAVTHGDFAELARIGQVLKTVIRGAPNWQTLPPVHREALDAILLKVARVLCGDPSHLDYWQDITGYALLVIARLP